MIWPFRRREDTYARIMREIVPLLPTHEDLAARERKRIAEREEVRRRNDRDGEYERGMEGFQ
jgi:hypothetical protein